MVQFGESLSPRWVCLHNPYEHEQVLTWLGDLLVSTGDDASIRTWKKSVNGHWAEYAEIETARDQ